MGSCRADRVSLKKPACGLSANNKDCVGGSACLHTDIAYRSPRNGVDLRRFGTHPRRNGGEEKGRKRSNETWRTCHKRTNEGRWTPRVSLNARWAPRSNNFADWSDRALPSIFTCRSRGSAFSRPWSSSEISSRSSDPRLASIWPVDTLKARETLSGECKQRARTLI